MVKVSAEASSLSSTLISRSAANAAVFAEPAIARAQIHCLRFIVFESLPFAFCVEPYGSLMGRGTPLAAKASFAESWNVRIEH